MSRFFNVKNDNSAVGSKIIWDEEINVLQPQVVAVLGKLRNGKEIVLPLKSTGKQEDDKICEVLQIDNISIDNSSINPAASSSSESKENIYNNYSSKVPLLEEHKNELSQIFSTIKEYPILTGRRTIRKLAENRKDKYTLKKFKIGEKEYYSLHQPYTFSGEKYCGSHLEKLEQIYSRLIKKSTETQYTGYFYQTRKHRNFTFHYTSEIDAQWNSQKFEIKLFKDCENRNLSSKNAYFAAIQCFYSNIKELIVGFYTDSHISLKIYTYDQLVSNAKRGKLDIENAKKMFKSNADQIIQFIKENDHQLFDKTVEITSTKNKMDFDVNN